MMMLVTPSPAQTRRRESRVWTDDEILYELRAWLDTTPRVSSAAYAQAQRANPDLPSLATVCKRFDGWANALGEIGYVGPHRVVHRYTDDEILDAVRSWIAESGDARADSY